MKKLLHALAFSCLSMILFGCGDKPQPEKQAKGHVWKEQVETIDRAKAVEGAVQDSLNRKMQGVDQ